MFDSDVLVENIKHLLNEKGVTAYRLSKDSGLSSVTLQKILDGRTTNPTIKSLYPIADYFGCTIDDLIGRTIAGDELPINATLLQASLDVLQQEMDNDKPDMTWNDWCNTLKDIYDGIISSSEARKIKKK